MRPMLERLAEITPRLPEGSAYCCWTAVVMHGFETPRTEQTWVNVPGHLGNARLRGLTVRRTALLPGDLRYVDGHPVTSPERTLADMMLLLGRLDRVVLVDQFLHAERVSVAGLKRWLAARTGRPGVRRLREALLRANAGAESPMETKLRLLLVSGRLPEPAVQFPITAGGRVIARADLCYPDSRLCIEYDGAVHRDTLIVDNQRQNRILEAGYTILRFTAPDLSNPHEVVRQVRAALKRAA